METIDVTQALRDAENSLRDFLASTLSRTLGHNWVELCGVSPERLAKWRERKKVEKTRLEAGVVDERLIYYADFYDLRTILKKHWSGEFSETFGDWKTFEVWLTELERFRDPDAHRRELLPHQRHLALGIVGEIRNRIVRYRSKKDTADDCFPRIESARDSLGNIWVPSGKDEPIKTVLTGMTLRPGDTVEFVVTARDPEGAPLEFGVGFGTSSPNQWQNSGEFQITITDARIAKLLFINVYIRSSRSFHAIGSFDDMVWFGYSVLPRQPN